MKHLQISEISQNVYRFSFVTEKPGSYEILGRVVEHPYGESVVSHCITMRAETILKSLVSRTVSGPSAIVVPMASFGEFFSSTLKQESSFVI